MKKIIGRLALVAMMFTMIGIVGCNSNRSKIIGNWKFYAKSSDGIEWKLIEYDNYADIRDDGTIVLRERNEEITLKWEVDGDELTISREGEDPYSATGAIESVTDEEMVLKTTKASGKVRYEKYKRVK